MRLFEIVAPSAPTQFAMSPKFASNYARYALRWPALPKKLLDFCNNKLQGYSLSADRGPFTGPLSYYSHVHLRVGPGRGDLIIAIYATDPKTNTLNLYELIPHKYYDGNNSPKLKKFLDNIPEQSFTVFDPNTVFSEKAVIEPEEILTDNDRKKVLDEIYYLISEEAFVVLKAALIDNDWDELLAWIADEVQGVSKTDLLAAFDGTAGLKDIILSGLKQYGKMDDFKEFLSQ